ncbi:hypothetical protein GCM10010331_45210 [Streptomyces xanthochromogenes]|uniref:hypothetical protein n=1 Tax=Streptomyces xanthochromogenes TaxID=67384 RepID=UPI001672A3F5|nr:hypothetical protein [Streptomyces xanthochromogenes]GHB52539.1 hypothetical protein GCM10010331_45210 [Streptomyces xanthochromogenes]
MGQHTVAVAGNGTISQKAVFDHLTDHFGYEAAEDGLRPTERAVEEVEFVFLAHPDLITRTVGYVYRWTGEADIGYTAVYSEEHPDHRAVQRIVEQADESHASGDVAAIYADVLSLLEARPGKTTLVILSDPDDDDGKDAGVDELAIGAAEAGLEVLDLGCGLAPYAVHKATQRALEDQEEPEVPEGAESVEGEAASDADGLQEEIAEAHRAKATSPVEPEEEAAQAPELSAVVLQLAEVVAEVLSSVESSLRCNLDQASSVLYDVRDALKSIGQPVSPPQAAEVHPEGGEHASAEPVDAPSVEPPEGLRKGWYNADLDEYLPFRGRPRRDVEKHDIIQNADGVWEKYEPQAA